MKLNTLLLAFLFLGLFSCKTDDVVETADETTIEIETVIEPNDCPVGYINIEITNLETEYDCFNTVFHMEINLPSGEFIVIENQQEFEQLVTGTCLPTIDFTTYELVIGKKGLTNGISSIDYELIEICESEAQTLTVTFNLSETANAPNVTFHALIPKLEIDQDFSVEFL